MAISKTYQWNDNGIKQSNRLPKALSGDYVKIDERSFDDLLVQMAEYAKRLVYFDDNMKGSSDWTDFFKDVYDYDKHELKKEHIEALSEAGDVPPHLALTMAFLKMYEVEQANLNTLTEKHLQFYYKDILGFKPHEGENGKATVFFEPVKNAAAVFIPKGTLFDAGKDNNGKPVTYRSVRDVTVNQMKVVDFFKSSQKTDSIENATKDNFFTKWPYNRRNLPRRRLPSFIPLSNSVTKWQDNPGNDAPISTNKSKAQQINGFAISSPILNLPDGKRTITLIGCDLIPNGLFIEFTGEKGWEKARYTDNKIIVEKNQGPFIPYDTKIHGDGFDGNYPILRFLFTTNVKVISYNKLGVTVEGSSNFVLENNRGTFQNTTGSMPWGVQPDLNSCFTITTNHKINLSAVHIHWIDDNSGSNSVFERHSNLKQSSPSSGCSLKANGKGYSIKLIKELGWSKFISNFVEESQKMFINNWIKSLYTDKNPLPEGIQIPQQPYTPTLAEPITIDFTIDESSVFNNSGGVLSPSLSIITPYGIRKGLNVSSLSKELTNMKSCQERASLSIKLNGVAASGVLTLYFEMNPFKYKLDGNYGKETPTWYYKSNAGWTAFAETDSLSDTTERFSHSGIVQLNIKNAAVSAADNPQGELWLRIDANTTDSPSSSFSNNPFDALEAVHAQAVEVEPDPQLEGQIETGIALPKGSITKAKTSIKGIKKIDQPYNGSEGRKDETKAQFYSRVSEKLRHKGRAWNGWDYERLVLERFPKVASVKCLPCYCCNIKGETRMEPGHVTLVVVPDLQAILQPDKLHPTIGKTMEAEIADYISQKASSFVELHVVSPTYKEAKVHCEIILRKGLTDTNHYKNLTNDKLIEYFAPWVSSETTEIEFKTNHNESQIQAFIESLEYVDHFEGFRLTIGGKDIDYGKTLQPDDATSIITSAKRHEINVQMFEK